MSVKPGQAHSVPPWQLQSPASRVAAMSTELHIDELDLAWQAYLSSGGFPRAVAEYHRLGRVSDAFLGDLVLPASLDDNRLAGLSGDRSA
jgi:hypothetical protein